jgi:hypothetical protein
MTVSSIKDIMGAFFSTLAVEEQDSVWKNFLVEKGLDPTLTPASAPSSYVSEFVDYAQRVYDRLLTEYNLSPDEVKKRQIMFMVFDLSLTMLKAIQNSIAVTANNMIITSRWQDEYTKMLTRVPIYTANPSEKMRIDLTDPTKCTFGYNDISVKDIAQYVVNQANISLAAAKETNTTAKAVSFAMQSEPLTYTSPANTTIYVEYDTTDGWKKIAYTPLKSETTFEMHIDPSSTGTNNGWVEIKQIITAHTHEYIDGATIQDKDVEYPVSEKNYFTFSTTDSSSETFSATVTAATNAALTTLKNSVDLTNPTNPIISHVWVGENWWPWNGTDGYYKLDGTTKKALTEADVIAQSNNFFIPWRDKQPYTVEEATDDPKKNANKDAESHRAETNSLLQQYLESIRAKRQSIRDRATTMQSSLDQTRESMSQQSNLLTSIIDTMKDLLGSIFK